ncbi:MAG: thermonuclease family protein [Oceanicaulis sp.]
MGRVIAFSRQARLRARALRRVRDAALVFVIVFVLAQPEVRSQIGSAAGALTPSTAGGGASAITCRHVRVIDGDTLDCAGERIRLAGIDAPELPGHCRPGRRCVEGDAHAARAELQRLAAPGLVCRPSGRDHYGRTIGRCVAAGRDLSCALVAEGHAERRYGPLTCSRDVSPSSVMARSP